MRTTNTTDFSDHQYDMGFKGQGQYKLKILRTPLSFLIDDVCI